MMSVKGVQQMIARGVNSVRQAFRGKTNIVDAAQATQRVQISGLADETLQALEYMQHFGLTSNPPEGTDAVVIPLGGKSSHGIIIATENGSFRLKNLQSGEVAVYDQSGSSIVLKHGRRIEMDCDKLNITAPGGVTITAPNVDCSAQLTAAGQINGNGGMAVQGGNGTTISGPLEQSGGDFVTDGDVQAGDISLRGHPHTDSIGGKTTPALPG